MNDHVTLCSVFDAVGNWLYDWQTLLSGLLALGAAIWAGRLLRRQIAQAEQFRRDELSKRHAGSRVALPLALSSIDKLCRGAASQIANEVESRECFDAAFHEASNNNNRRETFDPISLPIEVLSEMKGFVETLRGGKSVKHVAELISGLQIFMARFNGFDLTVSDESVRLGLTGLLIDLAKVRFLNDQMYNYSRFVDHKFAVVGRLSHSEAWDMIHEKAEGLIFARKPLECLINPLNERIQRYKGEDRSPWIEKFEV